MKKAYLIAAGMLEDVDFLESVLRKKEENELLVSVDAGLFVLHRLGIKPNIVLGDFDSVEAEMLRIYEQDPDVLVERHPPEKDASDLELALALCVKTGYRQIYIFGALGARMDHSLSNIYLCCHYIKKGISLYLLDMYNKIYVLKEGRSLYRKEQFGTYVSFYPMQGVVEDFSISGVKYPLSGVRLDKYEQPSFTLSNEILEEKADISFSSGILLVVESRDRRL